MYRLVLAMFFVENVLPSGGMSAVTYIAYALRKVSSVATTSLVQLSRYVFNYLAYVFVIFAAVVIIAASDPINVRALVIAIVLFVAIMINALMVAVIFRDKRLVNIVARWIAKAVNWFGRTFMKRGERSLIKGKSLRKGLREFHRGVDKIFKNATTMIMPFIYMVFATGVQLVIVYLAFVAIGESVNLGVLFISFALANLAGVISVVPGDVGVHEAAMIFVLSTAGVDPAVAVSATLLYRVYNKLIMVGIGFFFYANYLKPIGEKAL